MLVVDGYGVVGDRRPGSVGRRSRAATVAHVPRVRRDDETTVLDEDLQPAPPASSAGSPAAGRIPLGYYKDPEKTAATFPVVDGVRWSVPGDHAGHRRRRHRSRCSAAARCRSTPAARRCTPRRSRPALKGHADVFDAVVVGRARRAVGRAGRRGRASPAPAPRRRSTTLAGARCARSSPATRCRAHVVLVDADRALAVGQARLPLGQGDRDRRAAPATDRESTGHAVINRLARRDEPVPPPARRQPRRLVPVGRRGVRAGADRGHGRSSSRSATRRATGAT